MPDSTLIHGLFLGLAAAGTIGPVNIEIARRTLRIGWSSGFLLGCGACIVDVVYATVAALGVTPLLARHGVCVAMGIAGGLLLIALGILSALSARQKIDLSAPPRRLAITRGFLTGVAMTSINPITVAFWFVSFPASMPARGNPIVMALGVMLAAFGWICFYPAAIHFAGQSRRAGSRVLTVTDLLGSAALLIFGGLSIWHALH